MLNSVSCVAAYHYRVLDSVSRVRKFWSRPHLKANLQVGICSSFWIRLLEPNIKSTESMDCVL